MIFTTQLFLFVFFPSCITLYMIVNALCRIKTLETYIERYRIKDLVIIFFSLGFYMWSGVSSGLKLVLYILGIYIFSKYISACKFKRLYINIEQDNNENMHKKFYIAIIPLIISIAIVLFYLVYYKYSGIIAYLWNYAFSDNVKVHTLYAPLGLSFITFSAISYLVDIYKEKSVAGSFIDCALYILFFPKIVSGPIVLWRDFQKQISGRENSLELTIDGINRIVIGFSKKLLLADVFGQMLSKIGNSGIDQVTAIISLIIYMLQIYYDFSSYSDIAIGLSKLFGFEFKENFNFPYRSKSITEFWRRWHISLGTWFREYVYIPLGGNRKGKITTLRNLFIVFMLTGIWHGAGKNYILWGMINGGLMVLERLICEKKRYKKVPDFVKYVCTMMIVMFLWQFFRFENLSETVSMLGVVFGIIKFDRISYTWHYFLSIRTISFVIIGVLGATVLGCSKIQLKYQNFKERKVGYLIQEIVLMGLFILSICFMVNSTYSPFIYFQY